MKKYIVLVAVLAVFIASAYGVYSIDEKTFSVFAVEYIASCLTHKNDSFETKVKVIRKYVHDYVHPVGGEKMRDDTIAAEKLISGIGWCDQKSRVFMQLASKSAIRTRLAFLYDRKGTSPHTVAHAYDGKRWVVVDAAYDLNLINVRGQLADTEDIARDPGILTMNPRIMMFGLANPIWKDMLYLECYYYKPDIIYTKKASFNLMRCLPRPIARGLVSIIGEIYTSKIKNGFASVYEYDYFKARFYSMISRGDDAERLYRAILKGKEPHAIKDKTRFFYALYLRDSMRADESIAMLTELIGSCSNSAWLPYAYGLRSSIYRSIGDNERAKADFTFFAAYPDAYF